MATRLAALAALGATATAGLATTDLHRTGESPVPSEQLMPWRRTAIAASDLPSRGARPIVLYVSAACPHCEGVTRYVDSVARAHRRRLIVVSADADSVMARWMARTGIAAAVARDTALAMRRARTTGLILDRLEADKDQLPEGTDLAGLANYIAMALMGMSMQARDGMSTQDLLRVADRVMAAWPT